MEPIRTRPAPPCSLKKTLSAPIGETEGLRGKVRTVKLPLTPQRAGRRLLLVLGMTGSAVLLASPVGAHPGPVDTSGGHYCTAAQNASNLCAPPTYHRHGADGTQIVVTPGPEAAQLTGAQPATTATTAPAGVIPTTPPAPVAEAAPPLAQTGPMSWGVAFVGIGLAIGGAMALAVHRRIPLPVVLELDRSGA